jgi:hypothetical protein
VNGVILLVRKYFISYFPLNISFKHFLVNFPKRVVHEKNQCNDKQIKLMEDYSQKQTTTEQDPRWNKLKALKKEN